jgi:outer membrane protein TolC
MKTKYLIISLLVLLVNSISAQDKLSYYLEKAAENNPGLKARFSEYMAALEVVPQVGSLPDPQLAFGYFIQPIETRNGPQNFKISITQMFPWFGILGARKDIASSRARAKYEVFEDYKSNLFFEVKATYYELYFISKELGITMENIRILKSFRKLVLVKIESGKASGVDQLRIEMDLADMENDLAVLQDKWLVASTQFSNLLNLNDGIEIKIPDSLWQLDFSYSRAQILDSIKQNNHQLAKFDYLIESYQNSKEMARKSGMPSLSIGLDYIAVGKTDNDMISSSDNGRDAIVFPRIGISLPLYRKKYAAMVKEAVYMQDASVEQKKEKENILQDIFERTYYEYLDSQRRISLYQKQKAYSVKALNILEKEYATEGKDFEEILRMQKRLLMYSLELERAYSDRLTSVAFIKYLIGEKIY